MGFMTSVIPGWCVAPDPESRDSGSDAGHRPGMTTYHCVFATLGGAAVVTKLVASSMAGPNGVGMVMRNGTRMRVPAIGTKAISILRWEARYLITGRSGI